MVTLPMLSAFIDSLEEGVLFLDKDRRVVAINQAASRMVGQSDGVVLNQLCPSIFAGTECARECETRGYCSLMPQAGKSKKIQDIELAQPDNARVFLRMWALLLPPEAEDLNCAIILRDRSREVELEEEMRERWQVGGIIGRSPLIQQLYQQILRAAASDATILVTGESGVGKELVARALHDNSARAKGPYIPVHCGALPENLLESELFGHARGAFSGATSARTGRFEAAHGGTLLLDEIGEVSPGIQMKLLRVLQEREVVRLGENHARQVDVRVVAATHRNLEDMVKRGEFREDLYYRLKVLSLHVPALRERRDDIPLLASKMLSDLASRYKRRDLRLAGEAMRALETYNWPGNVRQLSNALEYAVVQADGPDILPRHLPPEVAAGNPMATNEDTTTTAVASIGSRYYRAGLPPEDEKALILRALQEATGNRAEAARRLGMSRTTLWKRLK